MIPRIESPISYAEFASHYLSENKPCIFANWITAKWAGCRDFALPGSPNAVNISALRKIYGHRDNVAVSDCLAENYGYASASKMNFSDFLDTWESGKCLYLKDFHFKRFYTAH